MARVEIPFVVQDTDGTAVENASIQVYLRGTTTPLSVWNSESGGGTVSLPLTTGPDGRINGWVNEGQSIDLNVSASGFTTYTQPWEALRGDALVITSRIQDGAVTTTKISDGQVTLAKLAADSVDSSKIVAGAIVDSDVNAAAAIQGSKLDTTDGRLKETVDVKAATGNLTLTTSAQDVPGATVTFTPDVACFALVTTIFDFSLSNVGSSLIVFGTLVVDGAAQSPVAIAQADLSGIQGTAGFRHTVSQVHKVTLSAASHTLKLQAFKFGTATAVANQPHTRFLYRLVAQ
jgi:hypothetical protein